MRSAGEACNGFHPQAAQQPLFDRGDDGAAGLLDTVGGRQPEDIPGIARLEYPERESRTAPVSREFSSFTQTPSFHKKKTRREPVVQAPCGFFFSCASRSRTYDGGVKVPCLTAWRWRIMQNSIAYFPLFHKRCAAFLQLFLCAVCRTCGGLGRFLGFAAGALRFPYPSMFLRKASFAGRVFQKTQSAGGTGFILQR